MGRRQSKQMGPTAAVIVSKILDRDDEEEILERIGSLDPDRLPVSADDIQAAVIAGKMWWQIHSEDIKKLVCNNTEIKTLSDTTGKALIDVVLPLLTPKFPEALAVYVAALTIRKILEGFCASDLEKKA